MWPGAHLAAGRDLERGVHQLRGLAPRGDRGRGLPVRRRPARRRGRDPASADRADRWASGTAPSPASRPGSATASAPTGRGSPTRGCGSTRPSCCSTPTPGRSAAIGRRRPGDLRLRRAARRRARRSRPRLRAVRARSGRRRTTTFDWGGRRAVRGTAGATRSSTSCTSRASPQLHDRVPEQLRGTYAGLATPAVTDYLRDLGVTAVELLPVHQFVSEPHAAPSAGWRTTGATTRSASSRRTTATPPRGDRGEQVREFKADGQGVPRRRARGDPRRRLQPHRRGRPRRADAVASAGSTTAATTSASTRSPASRLRDDAYWDVTGCGNTVDADAPARAAADPRLAALLGHRDARRRLPLRPRVRAGPHRPRRRHGGAAARPRSARTRSCGT